MSDRQVIRYKESLAEVAKNARIFKVEQPTGIAILRIFSGRQSLIAEVNGMLDKAQCGVFNPNL